MFAKDSSLVLQLEGAEMELHSEPFPLSLRTTHIQDAVSVSSFPTTLAGLVVGQRSYH